VFSHAAIEVVLFSAVLLLLVKPSGVYMMRAMQGTPPGLARMGAPLERLIYRLAGIDPDSGMNWKRYALSLLLFSLIGTLALYMLLRIQFYLPLNPQHFANISPDSAFNTAVSFVSNTSWQGYAGEVTMSYLSQMLGISVQSFLSGACGICVLFALIRGLARSEAHDIGNFWVDLTRSTLYILLPLSVLFSLAFVSQGVIQNVVGNLHVQTVTATVYPQPRLDAQGNAVKDLHGQPIQDSWSTSQQSLPMGPVASQESIKLLSGDGGGFFNANSAHPYENPTPLSNALQMLALLLIPAGLCHSFGRMVGDRRQGWTVLAAMGLLFLLMATVAIKAERAGNPLLTRAGADQRETPWQTGGNMEGKETRFGVVDSALYATVTTSSGDGAVNAMHDSFTPLGGLVPMALMQTGEVVFGGPGSGLFGMLVHAILAVFVSGLMIGRTPEYLGKKIEAYEIKMVSVVILATPLLILVGTALSLAMQAGLAGIANPGAHGLSEILYAFSSCANNNGSAFAGLSANTPYYNTALASAMWFGRFGVIIPVLAIAGSLAAKNGKSAGPGTLPTHDWMFVMLLIGVVVLVASLTYLPVLALGPVVEHLLMVHP
jgi:K+-transporting ATPase ATPase A chain